MGRRHRRIGRDIVVGMPEEVRHVEHEPGGISAGREGVSGLTWPCRDQKSQAKTVMWSSSMYQEQLRRPRSLSELLNSLTF